jgi:hypothetical protein
MTAAPPTPPRRRPGRPPAWLLAAAAAALAAPAPAGAAVRSLRPHDDAYATASAPRRTTRRATRLLVSGTPARVAFLRFAVPRLGAAPRRVTLRVYALRASGAHGVDLVATRGRWSQRTLTWRTAPARGRTLARHGRFRRGWIAFDLTRFVRGGGTYSFALRARGRRVLSFAAREAGARRSPRLRVDTPPAGGGTRPPGAPVLSDGRAAARVVPARETRPGNRAANHTMPSSAALASFRRASEEPYTSHVTGHFTGTTDEIVQWAAAKWGFRADLLRAAAVQESDWHQGDVSDGGVSFGLFSVKTQLAGEPAGWAGTFPLARDSTAFNADYYGRALRSCYDGRETWLGGAYASGDLWGCVGFWYSGRWHDAGGEEYVRSVRRGLAARTWAQPGF